MFLDTPTAMLGAAPFDSVRTLFEDRGYGLTAASRRKTVWKDPDEPVRGRFVTV
jgi:hypothetical protein